MSRSDRYVRRPTNVEAIDALDYALVPVRDHTLDIGQRDREAASTSG